MRTDKDNTAESLTDTLNGSQTRPVCMNRELLELRLEKVFGGTVEERRVVVRQAGDLHDSGRYAESHDESLAVDVIIANLAEAPDEYGLVERWNWWIGGLHIAHGRYDQFRVRRWSTE